MRQTKTEKDAFTRSKTMKVKTEEFQKSRRIKYTPTMVGENKFSCINDWTPQLVNKIKRRKKGELTMHANTFINSRLFRVMIPLSVVSGAN